MVLNSEQLLEQGIIIPSQFGAPAQVSYDLSIKNIRKIKGGFLGEKEKEINEYNDAIDKIEDTWVFDKGYIYSLTFNEGVKVPLNKVVFVTHKSSLLRIGCFIVSGLYDPGFECKEAGATLFSLSNHASIQKNAKIATLWAMDCERVSKGYDGSYQKEKDLK